MRGIIHVSRHHTISMRTPQSLAVLEEWYPKKRQRAELAKLVARCIRRVHRAAPASWELTHREGYLRLNVGQVAVMELFPDGMALYGMRTRARDSEGLKRHVDWSGYRAIEGRHERWLVEANRAPSLPSEILEGHDRLATAAWSAKRRSPHKRSHTPGAVAAIAQLCGQPLEQPDYFQNLAAAEIAEPGNTDRSMFGDAESNREVEVAAVNAVRRHYERAGWAVISRESDGCGYDLECTRGRLCRHVEVKGRSGREVAFMLTVKELAVAETDDNFQLAVVTEALTAASAIQFFDRKAFESGFVVRPSRYIARRATDPDAC